LIVSLVKRVRTEVGSAVRSLVRFSRRHTGWTILILGGLLVSSAVAPLLVVKAQREREVESSDLIKKRADWFFRPRAYPLGFVPVGARQRALEQTQRMREAQGLPLEEVAGRAAAAGLSTTNWTAIGPQPTTGDPFFGNTSGRVIAVAVDPRDTSNNTVYIGAADGGVWKTIDGGTTWTPLTDSQPALSTGALTLDPTSNPTTIYYGTGEENFAQDSLFGAGVLKSTNGGNTWTQDVTFTQAGSGSVGASGPFIGELSIQPSHPSVLLAAIEGVSTVVHSGVYRSADSGNSWTRMLPAPPSFDIATSVVFDPNDMSGNTAYAALGNPFGNASNGVYKSTNGGITWSALTVNGATQSSIGRVTLAVGPLVSGKTELFAAIADATTSSSNLLGLFKSTDAGSTWAKVTAAPLFCNAQCFFDMAVSVSPTTANTVFVGGSASLTGNAQLFRSTDGGMSWGLVSGTGGGGSIHVDVHAIAFSPDGNKLYVGNDGGVWGTTNPTATPIVWNNLNQTLQITQFYPSVSIHPTDRTKGFGGTQDNGTQQYSGSLTWTNIGVCGDGGWTLFGPNSPSNVYLTCVDVGQQGGGFAPIVNKSVNGGTSFSGATSGITVSDNSDFIPPLVIDSKSPQNLYFGTFRLYQTTNGATSWIQMAGGQDLTMGGGDFITTMAVAPSSSNTVYVGTFLGNVQVTTNALQGANATFTPVTAGLPPRSVTNLAVDPTTSTTAYVTFSGFSGFVDNLGHVFKTVNGGAGWTDISGNLPNIPVNDIAVDPADATGKTLDVATDAGVFQTTNAGASWSVLGSSLPNSEVLSLKLQTFQRVLRAGTHGRGVWDLSVPAAAAADFSFGSPSPGSQSVGAGGTTGAYTIPLSSLNGFSGPVALSCSGLPTGGVCNFSPNPVNVPANPSSSLTISTTLNTPPGTSTVTVTGTSGALTHSTTVSLTVNVPFNFGTPSPTAMSVAVNQMAQFTIPVNSTNGFNSAINLTCAPTPATTDFTCGAANFSPNPVTPPANGTVNTVLSITPTANALVPVAPTPKMPLGPWLFLVATLAAVMALATKQFGWPRRRIALGFSLALAVALLATMSACGGGGGGGGGTGPLSHTFTITITGTSGSLSNTQTVSLTIHP
jgi:hypothetical protein